MLIDTHAHLNFKDYNDLDEVIKRSRESGVEKIICVSSNIADSISVVEIAKKYRGIVFAAVGIHPQCTDPENKGDISAQLEKLEKLVSENKDVVVAIGECGLDFTEVIEGERKRSIEEQEELFQGQIKLANKYDLPILLHFNKAHDYFLDRYLDLKNMKGVFHCYVGGKKRLKRFLEFDKFLLGINGLATYDEGVGQVVKGIPINRLVLETDCPFLAPLPHRGERNEPAYIPLVAQKVAELKGISLEEISRQTGENVEKIFGI
ncbi:MAG: TatD family hydrolase [Patescibacteria group bacterium]|nr:TatD family hydrolase [Patescibacteria group bacterium]